MPAHSLHLFIKIRFSTFFMVKRWPMNYTDFQDKDFFPFLRYIFFLKIANGVKSENISSIHYGEWILFVGYDNHHLYFILSHARNIKNEIIFFQKVHFY